MCYRIAGNLPRQTLATARKPVDPILGDSISAKFGFDNSVRVFFESIANLAIPGQSNFNNLFGMSIECEQAKLELHEPSDCYIYPAPRVLPDQKHVVRVGTISTTTIPSGKTSSTLATRFLS